MGTPSNVFKQAKQEVLAGADRREVFQKYRDQISRPVKLAMTIAGIPKEPIPALGRILNGILLALLILAALLKALGIVGLLASGVPFPALVGIVLLGLLVPVLFAVAVAKWEGQAYLILPILCVVGILNSWVKSSVWWEAALDTFFLLAIAGLAIAVKRLVFPNIGWRGVKKDAGGEFAF